MVGMQQSDVYLFVNLLNVEHTYQEVIVPNWDMGREAAVALFN